MTAPDGAMVRAPRSESEGRLRSEPLAQVAQLVEQGIENPRVGSSILSLGTERKALEKSRSEQGVTSDGERRCGTVGPDLDQPAPVPILPTGRAATIGRLAAELGALVTAGDLEAARDVHETIGRLLGPVRSAEDGARGAVVIDLEAERRARR
jgi:hypothetical protein